MWFRSSAREDLGEVDLLVNGMVRQFVIRQRSLDLFFKQFYWMESRLMRKHLRARRAQVVELTHEAEEHDHGHEEHHAEHSHH